MNNFFLQSLELERSSLSGTESDWTLAAPKGVVRKFEPRIPDSENPSAVAEADAHGGFK